MPKIKIAKTTQMPAAEAFQRVKTMMLNDGDLKRMDPSCQFEFNDTACKGTGKGKMFSANVSVSTAGQVVIEVDLPLMLAPAKGMVEMTLEKKLNAALGDSAT